jgi:5'-nucleotidase
MSDRPRVLLANDDGIRAEGIAGMWQALRRWADVQVVAPETPQSATGHGVTLHGPLLTDRVELPSGLVGIAVDGRPADCVKLALQAICPEIDLVVSGINQGANVGVDVFYSGTVAAAVEGAFLGKPAFAVSRYLAGDYGHDYVWTGEVALRVIRQIWDADAVQPGEVVNINVPPLRTGEEPSGVEVVPQCVRPWTDTFERRTDPAGRDYYWNKSEFSLDRSHGETDVMGLKAGRVVVTPLHFDLTARDRMPRVAAAVG